MKAIAITLTAFLGIAALGAAAPALAQQDLQKMSAPDGTYFIAVGDGSARHAASGLVCPTRIGKYERKSMAVLNPADGGRDVMCQFYSDTSWFSVFNTRVDDGSLEDVFDGYVKEAYGQRPPEQTLEAPGPVRTDLPVKSAFWVGNDGNRQGMWVARKGRWYLEARVTYTAGEEADVASFAQAIFDLVSRPAN